MRDNFKVPLEADQFFHIFNHANGSEQLFRNDDNYAYFLKKYHKHIVPIADTYAYCLMPNHFHLLVKIKPLTTLTKFETLAKYKNVSDFLSKQFSNWFSSYAQSYNVVYKRKGNLFMRPFGRIKIGTSQYLQNVLCYIHQNPVHHFFVRQPEDWKYSSYTAFYSSSKTLLQRDEVVQWFDDKENFRYVHEQSTEKYSLEMELTY